MAIHPDEMRPAGVAWPLGRPVRPGRVDVAARPAGGGQNGAAPWAAGQVRRPVTTA